MSRGDIQYSTKYEDNMYIYRYAYFSGGYPMLKVHVILPEDMAKLLPKTHLMTETEWRNLGIQMTSGWMHYMRYDPEPHIVPFRRLKKTNDSQPT